MLDFINVSIGLIHLLHYSQNYADDGMIESTIIRRYSLDSRLRICLTSLLKVKLFKHQTSLFRISEILFSIKS